MNIFTNKLVLVGLVAFTGGFISGAVIATKKIEKEFKKEYEDFYNDQVETQEINENLAEGLQSGIEEGLEYYENVTRRSNYLNRITQKPSLEELEKILEEQQKDTKKMPKNASPKESLQVEELEENEITEEELENIFGVPADANTDSQN